MDARRIRVTIPANHELTVRLPDDIPAGEAEIIVLPAAPRPRPPAALRDALDSWIRTLPAGPEVPLDALRRENLYD